MNRNFLKELGLSDEQVDKVMAEHGKNVSDAQANESKLTAVEADRDALQKQLDEANNQLDGLSKDKETGEGLKAKLQEAVTEIDNVKKQAEIDSSQIKKDYEIKFALREAGALNDKATLALLDTEAITVNSDGQLIGLSEQLENLKSENSFLFAQPDDKKSDETKPIITTAGNPEVPNNGSSDADDIVGLALKDINK